MFKNRINNLINISEFVIGYTDNNRSYNARGYQEDEEDDYYHGNDGIEEDNREYDDEFYD